MQERISVMKIILSLCFYLLGVCALPTENVENDIPAVDPEYLDMLLANKKYDEFSELMGIEDVQLSHPRKENATDDPKFNRGLYIGDILLTPRQTEQARQGVLFNVYDGSKWSTNVVPYYISYEFTSTNRRKIIDAINTWNSQVSCIKWKRRQSEKDYVKFFPGNGCYSNLGQVGNQQPISLAQNGCMRKGTILHEMNHAIGFTHEQNRYDRDDYIKMLWENIPEDWHSQYEKTSPEDFGLQGPYDYYSVMHYPMAAPGTGKPAFEVLDKSIDVNSIGQRQGFTNIDLEKISKQYC